VVDRKICEKQA